MGDDMAEYGSNIIVDMLKSLGIKYAALNPGASFRGIHDSLVNYNNNKNPVVNTFRTMVPLLASRRISIPIEDEDLAAAGGAAGGAAGAAGADGAVNTFGADLTKDGRGKGPGKGSLRDRLTERGGRGASGRGRNLGGRNAAQGLKDRALNAVKGAGGAAGATRSFGKGGSR